MATKRLSTLQLCRLIDTTLYTPTSRQLKSLARAYLELHEQHMVKTEQLASIPHLEQALTDQATRLVMTRAELHSLRDQKRLER